MARTRLVVVDGGVLVDEQPGVIQLNHVAALVRPLFHLIFDGVNAASLLLNCFVASASSGYQAQLVVLGGRAQEDFPKLINSIITC